LKKLIVTLLACVCLTGCGSADSDEIEEKRIKVVSREGQRYIFVDTETNVMYLYVRTGYSGGLTVMLDADGKPMIWNE
jgi:hypothetical protein